MWPDGARTHPIPDARRDIARPAEEKFVEFPRVDQLLPGSQKRDAEQRLPDQHRHARLNGLVHSWPAPPFEDRPKSGDTARRNAARSGYRSDPAASANPRRIDSLRGSPGPPTEPRPRPPAPALLPGR